MFAIGVWGVVLSKIDLFGSLLNERNLASGYLLDVVLMFSQRNEATGTTFFSDAGVDAHCSHCALPVTGLLEFKMNFMFFPFRVQMKISVLCTANLRAVLCRMLLLTEQLHVGWLVRFSMRNNWTHQKVRNSVTSKGKYKHEHTSAPWSAIVAPSYMKQSCSRTVDIRAPPPSFPRRDAKFRLKFDGASREGEEGVVTTHAHIDAGMKLSASLTYDDISWNDSLRMFFTELAINALCVSRTNNKQTNKQIGRQAHAHPNTETRRD